MAKKENSKIRVRFAVDDDEQANKICALLEALGYEAIRDVTPMPPKSRLRWAVHRLAVRAHLTEREQDILGQILAGRTNSEIADDSGASKATIKWHMHNIFAKTGVTTREALLRQALQLVGSTSHHRDDESADGTFVEPLEKKSVAEFGDKDYD
jgi:DNA-binding CsgD family transcriptional regulator